MQVTTLVHLTHLLLELGDNFHKIAHNIGEEGHTAQHDKHSEDALKVVNGVEVTISHCTQGGQSEVTTDDQSVVFVKQVHSVER